MSMRNYSICGFGVFRAENKIDNSTLCDLIIKHEDTLRATLYEEDCEDIVQSALRHDNLYDECGWYESNSGWCGALGILADIMAAEQGIPIEYQQGDYEDAIMLCESMPWNYSEKELSLTEQKLIDIFHQYLPNAVVGYIDLEYYG